MLGECDLDRHSVRTSIDVQDVRCTLCVIVVIDPSVPQCNDVLCFILCDVGVDIAAEWHRVLEWRFRRDPYFIKGDWVVLVDAA